MYLYLPRFLALKDAGIQISMDGKGRWMDNVMIERLWRSLKYEGVYLPRFEADSEVRQGLKAGSTSTTPGALTPVWTTGHRMRHIGKNPGLATPARHL